MLLGNMEEKYIGNLEYLESSNIYMLKNTHALNITSDALNFVSFVKKEMKNIDVKGNMIDIGAGIGTLSFLLLKENKFKKIYNIEIQKSVFEILKENIKINNLDFELINDDANILKSSEFSEKFSFVISNPPFYKLNSGFLPEDEIIRNSKFEVLLKLEDLMDIAYNILEKKGHFFLIMPLDREKEVLKDKRFRVINIEKNINKKKSFIFFNMIKI